MSCACSLSQLLRSTRDIQADALALRVALDGEPSNVMAWIVREKAAFTEGGRDAAEFDQRIDAAHSRPQSERSDPWRVDPTCCTSLPLSSRCFTSSGIPGFWFCRCRSIASGRYSSVRQRPTLIELVCPLSMPVMQFPPPERLALPSLPWPLPQEPMRPIRLHAVSGFNRGSNLSSYQSWAFAAVAATMYWPGEDNGGDVRARHSRRKPGGFHCNPP